MTPTIDVTVIVPCYNTERFLDQALCSAEQNASCNLEILVLNDGSTDGSLAIMRAHEARDGRVRVIDKPNEGYGATVNRGIDEARGRYVAILEPDDFVVQGAYDDMLALARDTGWPDMVKTSYWRVLSGDSADAVRVHGYLHGRVRGHGRLLRLVEEPGLIQYHPSVWAALYARDFLWREHIRMQEVPGAGWVDNPFSVWALAAAKEICYTEDAYYCYREDLAGASSATVDARLMIERWCDRQDVLDNLGVVDEGILRANYVAGLRFLARMMADGSLGQADVAEGATRMARRMDPRLLSTITHVSPKVVRKALELSRADDVAAPSRMAYDAHLAYEAWWALRNNGVSFLAHNLMVASKR